MITNRLPALALAAALAVGACAGSPGSTPAASADPPSASPGGPASPPSTPPSSADPSGPPSAPPSAPSGGVTLTQPWATAPLVDVRTGQAFTIGGLVADGRVVFVETMAIWCTNCRRQQEQAVAAMAQLDRSKVTWVGLDVESSESAEALARYSEDNGFDFTYAIVDRDLARALVADFGEAILNPPSVNVVVVGPDGRVTPSRGHKSADDIVALAADHGA